MTVCSIFRCFRRPLKLGLFDPADVGRPRTSNRFEFYVIEVVRGLTQFLRTGIAVGIKPITKRSEPVLA